MSDMVGPSEEPDRPRRFGRMGVIDTDQFAGRYYRCACGWEGWSTWGHAARHAASCELSDTPPEGFVAIEDSDG